MNIAVETIRIPCPFCDHVHAGEFWEDVDEQIMRCRERAAPRKRGDLAAYDPEEFSRYAIATVESLIPRDAVLIEDRSGVLGDPQGVADNGDSVPAGDDPSSDCRC